MGPNLSIERGQISISKPDADSDAQATVIVTVSTRPHKIIVDIPPSLLVNKPVVLVVGLKDANGQDVTTPSDWPITATCASTQATVTVTGNQILLTPLVSTDIPVTISVSDPQTKKPFLSIVVIASVPQVAGFKLVSVRLDVMDEQTSAILFGSETAKSFYYSDPICQDSISPSLRWSVCACVQARKPV